MASFIYHGNGSWPTLAAAPGSSANQSAPPGAAQYRPERDEWQIVYLGAVTGAISILHGGRRGQDIVLHGTDADGHNRWTFTDIRHDSFTWTGEISADGTTYHVNHRMTGTRRASESTHRAK